MANFQDDPVIRCQINVTATRDDGTVKRAKCALVSS